MAQNYNDTIHKMQTPFEMRAGLPKKEPKMLEDWEQNHVYEQMIKNNEGKPRWVLHDGPPYANGNIHMGRISSCATRTWPVSRPRMCRATIPTACPSS